MICAVFISSNVPTVLKNLFKQNDDNLSLPSYLHVEKRRVKWARIEVRPPGQVHMVVPKSYRQCEIVALYRQKLNWIERKLNQLSTPPHEALGIEKDELLLFGQGYKRVTVDSTELRDLDHTNRLMYTRHALLDTESQISWYRGVAKSYLTERIRLLAAQKGFRFQRLFIRAQRTRWGSCSSRGNISLNWKLVKAPVFVSDYVMLHELVHTEIMNHSAAFWRRVATVSPAYLEAKEWLKRYGPYL